MADGGRATRRLGRRAVVVGTLAVAAALAGLWCALSRRMSDPLERANRAYEARDWELAARLARAGLKAGKADQFALRLLARSAAHLGHDETTVAIYAHRLDQTLLEAEDYLLLGESLAREGREAAAARAWQRVPQAARVSPSALDQVARAHLGAHRLPEAAQLAERLSRYRGWEAKGFLMLGAIRARLSDLAGAVESFRRALDIDPAEIARSHEPVQLRVLIAQTFLRAGHPSEARKVLEPIHGGSQQPEIAWLLSRAYLQQGDKARAQSALALAGSYRAQFPLEPEPAPYVGEARCAECHRQVVLDSLTSRHSTSYYRGAQLLGLPRTEHPVPDPDDASVTHAYALREGSLCEETRAGNTVFIAVVEYAFGTADRYVTMVAREETGKYRIGRLSYSHLAQGLRWRRTVLDRDHPSSKKSEEFRGKVLAPRDGVIKCLYCHATNPRPARGPAGPEDNDHGVGCERCHGPGGNHIAAVNAGLSDLAIVNPVAASPAAITIKQCNDCHILGPSFGEHNAGDPEWARSQGVGWTMSRCNTESSGAFGCVTCHDPHKSARSTATAAYEAKCLDCHSTPGRSLVKRNPASTIGSASGKLSAPCPIDPHQGCVSCHMPKVHIDSLQVDLTDHYIRIPQPKR